MKQKNAYLCLLLAAISSTSVAADSRMMTKLTTVSTEQYMQAMSASMAIVLVNSPVVRLLYVPEAEVELEVILDGHSAAESGGTVGGVVAIFTVRCRSAPSIYVGHQVGFCGGSRIAECGQLFAKTVEVEALKVRSYLQSPKSCR